MRRRAIERHIDLDKLIEDIRYSGLKNDRVVMEIIRDQPVIGPETTVWIDERSTKDYATMKCARCGMRVNLVWTESMYKYCPHCGKAVEFKMRKVRNGRCKEP